MASYNQPYCEPAIGQPNGMNLPLGTIYPNMSINAGPFISTSMNVAAPPQWAPPAPPSSNCPPGLEHLQQLSTVLVRQQVDPMEMVTHRSTPNKYLIMNPASQLIFSAAEMGNENAFYLIASRGFNIAFYNNDSNMQLREAFRISRPGGTLCQPYCNCTEDSLDSLAVWCPVGTQVGSMKQVYAGCRLKFEVKDATGVTILLGVARKDACCNCDFTRDFDIFALDGTTLIGSIQKEFTNYVQEYRTRASNFNIRFPQDMDARCKATLIGACIWIDFMLFDVQPDRNRHSHHQHGMMHQ